MSDFDKLRRIVGVKNFQGIGDLSGMTKFNKLRNIIGVGCDYDVPKKLVIDIGERYEKYDESYNIELTEEEGEIYGALYETVMESETQAQDDEAMLYPMSYIDGYWLADHVNEIYDWSGTAFGSRSQAHTLLYTPKGSRGGYAEFDYWEGSKADFYSWIWMWSNTGDNSFDAGEHTIRIETNHGNGMWLSHQISLKLWIIYNVTPKKPITYGWIEPTL